MTASVRRRFAYTITTNFVRSSLGFVTGMLLARWLGPKDYGNMAFLLGTFIGVRQLLDMGTSSAFFTFLSQQPRSRHFVWSYFVFLFVQFFATLAVIALFFPTAWVDTVWHGEDRGLVLLAFAAAFMQHSLWPVIQQAGESQRRTLRTQSIGLTLTAVHMAAVVLLWAVGALGLYTVFAAIVLEHVLAAVVAHRAFEYQSASEAAGHSESALRRYVRYCLPLVPYSCFCFAYEFVDRWMLQKYGGSVQQAYYAVGAQFSGIALIATSSILRIFWKEIAEAHHLGNHERTGRLYLKVSRTLFFVGAVIAGFLIPWADSLLHLILGTAYIGGATTLSIMFLYPVHQSMGQIVSTMLLATERINVQVISGIAFMVLSMIVTYFVLSPPDSSVPGLGMESEGLAIKMVVMQVFQVNVIAYAIARMSRWPFDWIYQPVALAGCMALGWLTHALCSALLPVSVPVLATIMLAGVTYCISAGLFLYSMPSLVGLTRDEIALEIQRVALVAGNLMRLQ